MRLHGANPSRQSSSYLSRGQFVKEVFIQSFHAELKKFMTKFSVMTLGGRTFYFISAATIRQLSEVIIKDKDKSEG
jgi:hypothetical protein